ncbi:MAG: hypothetical protein WD036_05565 [Bauldia sp.]
MGFVAVLALMMCAPASARQWRTTPEAAARDYLMILDERSESDLAAVWWIAPQMLPARADSETARKQLGQYLIIAAVHMHLSDTGTASFEATSDPELTIASGPSPTRIEESSLPPVVQGNLTALQGVFLQILGPLGNGMKLFVFGGSAIDSCGNGVLSVSYEGEKYTYEMPIPGCPSP